MKIKKMADKIYGSLKYAVELLWHYSISFKNSDASKGKRGGYRVITYVLDPEKIVR